MGLVYGDIPGKKGLRAQSGQLTGWATILCSQGSASAAPSHPINRGDCCPLGVAVLAFCIKPLLFKAPQRPSLLHLGVNGDLRAPM